MSWLTSLIWPGGLRSLSTCSILYSLDSCPIPSIWLTSNVILLAKTSDPPTKLVGVLFAAELFIINPWLKFCWNGPLPALLLLELFIEDKKFTTYWKWFHRSSNIYPVSRIYWTNGSIAASTGTRKKRRPCKSFMWKIHSSSQFNWLKSAWIQVNRTLTLIEFLIVQNCKILVKRRAFATRQDITQ